MLCGRNILTHRRRKIKIPSIIILRICFLSAHVEHLIFPTLSDQAKNRAGFSTVFFYVSPPVPPVPPNIREFTKRTVLFFSCFQVEPVETTELQREQSISSAADSAAARTDDWYCISVGRRARRMVGAQTPAPFTDSAQSAPPIKSPFVICDSVPTPQWDMQALILAIDNCKI
ncbi:MAG: hypothetical protein IK104_08060 [Clostridia bacterium]|nr:hypothetical protein [Clostridia bacterium]